MQLWTPEGVSVFQETLEIYRDGGVGPVLNHFEKKGVLVDRVTGPFFAEAYIKGFNDAASNSSKLSPDSRIFSRLFGGLGLKNTAHSIDFCYEIGYGYCMYLKDRPGTSGLFERNGVNNNQGLGGN